MMIIVFCDDELKTSQEADAICTSSGSRLPASNETIAMSQKIKNACQNKFVWMGDIPSTCTLSEHSACLDAAPAHLRRFGADLCHDSICNIPKETECPIGWVETSNQCIRIPKRTVCPPSECEECYEVGPHEKHHVTCIRDNMMIDATNIDTQQQITYDEAILYCNSLDARLPSEYERGLASIKHPNKINWISEASTTKALERHYLKTGQKSRFEQLDKLFEDKDTLTLADYSNNLSTVEGLDDLKTPENVIKLFKDFGGHHGILTKKEALINYDLCSEEAYRSQRPACCESTHVDCDINRSNSEIK